MPDFDLDQALAAPQNTKLRYMYRDAGNWKTHAELALSGSATFEDFAPYLDGGENFIADDVDMEELQPGHRNEPNEDDHVWHELVDLEPTEEAEYAGPVADLLAKFKAAHERGWQVGAALERLGIT